MTQGLNQIPGFEYYIADGQMLDDEIFYSSEEDAHAARTCLRSSDPLQSYLS